MQTTPDTLIFRSVENPVSLQEVIDSIHMLQICPHHSLSFTGGEPLRQSDYLSEIAFQMKEQGTKIFLETNGTLPDELKKCPQVIDYIAMDWKLPSCSGERDFRHEHLYFLELGAEKELFVKIIVTDTIDMHDFQEVCALISTVKPSTPIVLQPVFQTGCIRPPSTDTLFRLYSLASKHLENVRVIPQMHRYLGLR
jgi:organic radical activating enzyme